jgi:hypothetical protein
MLTDFHEPVKRFSRKIVARVSHGNGQCVSKSNLDSNNYLIYILMCLKYITKESITSIFPFLQNCIIVLECMSYITIHNKDTSGILRYPIILLIWLLFLLMK